MLDNTNNPVDLNNPNDKFFKGIMALRIVAEPMIRECLTKDLLDKLDFNTLKVDPNSYINDELKENFSDFVWSCYLKGSKEERKIALLLEHKSSKPKHPHFQINDYQRGAWKLQLAADQKLVPIIPIVFYHGLEKWVYEPFDSYFGVVEPETLRFLPCFDYILINLQDYSDARIKTLKSVYLQKTFLSFKHYLDKNYLELHIVEILFSGYESKKDTHTLSFIRMNIVYLTAISGITRQQVIQKAKHSDNNLNLEAMTIIDEFIEEGKEIGKEEGIAIAISIINLYNKGLTAESIADKTGYSVSKVKQIITDYLIAK